jgi:hypothetical protein
MSEPLLRGGDVLRQQVAMAVGLGLLAVKAGSRPGVDVAGKAILNKSRSNHTPKASLPGCEILCKFKKNTSFLNFSVTTGRKASRRDVANQALNACLLKRDFEWWTVKQMVRFCAAILLSGHGFEVNWICRRLGDDSSRWLRWVGHYGTKHYIRTELGTELRVARPLLVGFLWKKVHSKAYVVTELHR